MTTALFVEMVIGIGKLSVVSLIAMWLIPKLIEDGAIWEK